jgi:hypothetical protein
MGVTMCGKNISPCLVSTFYGETLGLCAGLDSILTERDC